MKITAKTTPSFKGTKKRMESITKIDYISVLRQCGEAGVSALASATPKDTGNTADQWRYEIEKNGPGHYSIIFCNDNVNKGVNIAVILQYGHGTGTGGYVEGVDYINPAMAPIAEQLQAEVSKLLQQ